MKTPTLKVSSTALWPLDAVTETFWWSGQRGSGKTHDASVFVEELLSNKVQVLIIDPMRAWWGLRSSVDGKRPGYGIPIFGGPRGDAPLESSAGEYLADLAMAERISMILDVKGWSKAELRRFTQAFLSRLLDRNTEALHIVVEETPIFAPQKPMPGDQVMLGVVESVVRLGRGSGLGFSAISQRSAHLNAEVRAQIEVVVAHHTGAPLDRKAIKEWFEVHDPERVSEAMARLPFLPTGTAIVSSTQFLHTFGEVAFRPRKTFDSSATPRVGQARTDAKTLADVDMAAIKEAMAGAIERADAVDPRKLQARIRQLEKELAHISSVVPEPEVVTVTVEMPVVPVEELQRLLEALQPSALAAVEVQALLEKANHPITATKVSESKLVTVARGESRHDPAPMPESLHRMIDPESNGNGSQTPAKQKILDALAWITAYLREPDASREQLALLVGMSPKGGTYANYLSALKTAGLIDYPASRRVGLTPEGREQAQVMPAVSSQEMQEMVFKKVGAAKAKILRALIEAYPEPMPKEWLAATVGQTPGSGTFANYLSSLRTYGLIDYPARGQVVALPVLFID